MGGKSAEDSEGAEKAQAAGGKEQMISQAVENETLIRYWPLMPMEGGVAEGAEPNHIKGFSIVMMMALDLCFRKLFVAAVAFGGLNYFASFNRMPKRFFGFSFKCLISLCLFECLFGADPAVVFGSVSEAFFSENWIVESFISLPFAMVLFPFFKMVESVLFSEFVDSNFVLCVVSAGLFNSSIRHSLVGT